MTLLESARKNRLTPVAKQIAKEEGISEATLLQRIRQGTVVIPLNNTHSLKKPCGVGLGLRTKVNANIGTTTDNPNPAKELKKLAVAIQYGADAVMDLSIGGNLQKMRAQVLRRSTVPVGTVPVYEIAVRAQEEKGNFLKFTAGDMLSTLEAQAQQGVDFFTIHAGVTRASLATLKKNKRVLDIVSRGGAIIAGWMRANNQENPFYEYFDSIIDIAQKYDVTLSLGDGMRPGSVLDATDRAQITELKILGQLALRARKQGVQVMIEGPGHVPLNQIEKNMRLEKKLCHGAPFYVLGPLVTDVAAGHDHITGAIGGAIAAAAGADFLCYVTPSEHLRHPSIEDVQEGVVASRIAAHAADIIKRPDAIRWDKEMSIARQKRDWKKQIACALDPIKAKKYRQSSKPHVFDVCTMCGRFCAVKLSEQACRSS